MVWARKEEGGTQEGGRQERLWTVVLLREKMIAFGFILGKEGRRERRSRRGKRWQNTSRKRRRRARRRQ
jgi:hypothetical protein